jgi:hypothetical protein
MNGTASARSRDGTQHDTGMPTDDRDKKARELHIQLITFLFSITIGRLAVEASRIAAHAGPNWSDARYWPSYTHLLLAAVVVILSWIGWRSSGFSAKGRLSASVFSSAFLELCVDIALVVLYFRLVSGAELAEFSSHECRDATDEAFTVMLIFILYALWDLVSKVFAEAAISEAHGGYLSRGWVSFGAACFSVVAYIESYRISAEPAAVCCFDFSLIALAVWFREMKVICSRHQAAGRIQKRWIGLSAAMLAAHFVLLSYSLTL